MPTPWNAYRDEVRQAAGALVAFGAKPGDAIAVQGSQLARMGNRGHRRDEDVPSWWTLAGTVIIISSGIYLLFRERQTSGPDGPASSATVVEG